MSPVSVLVSVVVVGAAVPSSCRSSTADAEGSRQADVEPTRAVETVGFSAADYAQHVKELKANAAEFPERRFTILIEEPFVVIGNSDEETVRRFSRKTVKWAVEKLKQDYFRRNPTRILDIWLFRDDDSYREYAWELFGDRPTTPCGYYSSEHGALVMNISTGGGTLVHEIVHPFMEANFPQCPVWFNEGLASLYEQSAERDGRIVGLTNWSLRGLKQMIHANDTKTFEALCGTTTSEFYDGDNYSQARYLCYYLQEQGRLREFFHEFAKNADSDPTGYTTLKRVLGNPDMTMFQREWERSVSALRF